MSNDDRSKKKQTYNAATTPAATRTKRRYRNNPVLPPFPKKKKRYVPMRLTIRTLKNQAVPNVHPGTSIQQPIYSEKKVVSELILGRRKKKITNQGNGREIDPIRYRWNGSIQSGEEEEWESNSTNGSQAKGATIPRPTRYVPTNGK